MIPKETVEFVTAIYALAERDITNFDETGDDDRGNRECRADSKAIRQKQQLHSEQDCQRQPGRILNRGP